jgi:hypothetical protein
VVVVHRMAGFERLGPQISRPHRVELAHHGGRDNGELPMTHRFSTLRGVYTNGVPALAELIALGFIEMTPGRANPNAAYGRAARFPSSIALASVGRRKSRVGSDSKPSPTPKRREALRSKVSLPAYRPASLSANNATVLA